MPLLKAAGVGGTILVILALIITLLKQIIAFIAFITGAIKLLIVLAFVILIVGVGLAVLRSFNQKRKNKS
jgi:hypothetical protein